MVRVPMTFIDHPSQVDLSMVVHHSVWIVTGETPDGQYYTADERLTQVMLGDPLPDQSRKYTSVPYEAKSGVFRTLNKQRGRKSPPDGSAVDIWISANDQRAVYVKASDWERIFLGVSGIAIIKPIPAEGGSCVLHELQHGHGEFELQATEERDGKKIKVIPKRVVKKQEPNDSDICRLTVVALDSAALALRTLNHSLDISLILFR